MGNGLSMIPKKEKDLIANTKIEGDLPDISALGVFL